jgi:hypothetical protein
MLGPTAAITSSGFVPNRDVNDWTATIDAPAAVPFQPA